MGRDLKYLVKRGQMLVYFMLHKENTQLKNIAKLDIDVIVLDIVVFCFYVLTLFYRVE